MASRTLRIALTIACTALAGIVLGDDGLNDVGLVTRIDAVASDFARDGSHRQPGLVRVTRFAGRAGSGEPVVVFVEPRLLTALEGKPETQTIPDLRADLDIYRQDLEHDGWNPWFFTIELEPRGHRDGELVLSLREVLRATKRELPALRGAILVGHFPDALLVRTVNWRKHGKLTLNKKKTFEKSYRSVAYLRTVPEDVARRCDLILGDLDGNWEHCYTAEATQLATCVAAFADGVPADGGQVTDYERSHVRFVDFFHANDGHLDIETIDESNAETDPHPALVVRPRPDQNGTELSAQDRERPNPIAIPELCISRIDSRGVALRPNPAIVGIDGAGLLDEHGQPRIVRFADNKQVPATDARWLADPVLERQLLHEYFTRNHRYRSGAFDNDKPASFACDLGSGFGVVKRASAKWKDFGEAGYDVHGRPELYDLAKWLTRPAVLRTYRAHSDGYGSVIKKGSSEALDAFAHRPWAWTRFNSELRPSFHALCKAGRADFFLFRTLWQNGLLEDNASIYLHTGCNGISPPHARNLPYQHPDYGKRQGAEAMLFYAQGLALIGRSKVFYDEPRGFADVLRQGGTVGDAWRRYFEIESRAASFGKVGGDIGRKRSYFWSVIGDWTLRLRVAKA